MEGILHTVTDATFDEEVLQYDGLVLVDVWADWCQSCKVLKPTIESLAQQFEGRVKFVLMDLAEAPITASTRGIQSVPTLMFFYRGELVSQTVGTRSEEFLAKKLTNYLNRAG